MQDFGDILDNSVLLVAVVACLIAQASKLVIELIKIKVNVRVLVTTGDAQCSFCSSHLPSHRCRPNIWVGES